MYGIPYFDGARGISAGDVEAAGREASDGGLGGVADILLADGRVINVPKKYGVARLLYR